MSLIEYSYIAFWNPRKPAKGGRVASNLGRY